MYAPSKPSNRVALWHEIADSIDKSQKCLIAGDFNMVKDHLNRKGGSSRIVNGREKSAWKRLARKLCLVGHLNYTWDSKKRHHHNPMVRNSVNIGDRVLKRIDRVNLSLKSCCVSRVVRPS